MDKDDSSEPDAQVLKLTKVLQEMDDAFSSTLHPRKTRVSKKFFIQQDILKMYAFLVYLRGSCSFSFKNFDSSFQLFRRHRSSKHSKNVQEFFSFTTNFK